MKLRKCKMCNDQFEVNPFKPLVPVCSVNCAIDYQRLLKTNKEAKELRDKMKIMKEGLLTHKDYLKMLQTIFNTFIRLRDKGKPCISCGCYMDNRKGDASHYYSVGSNPSLRFNESNVHLSCVPCNQHLHGNIAEYAIRLPFRIGYRNFIELENLRNEPLKLTIPEIKEKIKYYKQQIKELSK